MASNTNNHYDTEALEYLISAIRIYQDDLQTNRLILENAASVCDQAMGNDAIVQKHIGKLNDALDLLQKTSNIAEEVATALLQDKKRAMEAYNA